MEREKINIFAFDSSEKDLWEEREKIFICKAPQRSPSWHKLRKYRLTASNFAAGAGISNFTTDEDLYQQKVHDVIPEISDFSRKLMDHGTRMEDPARIWYEKIKGVKVIEYGLAIPKWDKRIGASVDGVVLNPDGTDSEGMIEIKCPMKIYPGVKRFNEAKLLSWKPSAFYLAHIKIEHYCQMIGGMAILGKKWCDYVVYPANGAGTIVRVYYDAEFWDKYLYPKIDDFMKRVESGLDKKSNGC